MVNDLIGDSLSRIKNALTRGKGEVNLERSKMVEEICRVLKEKRRIVDYRSEGREVIVTLTSPEANAEVETITNLKRVSTPGLRIYRGYKELRPILEGFGFAILTTPKGILTDVQARDQKVGGEIICEIY